MRKTILIFLLLLIVFTMGYFFIYSNAYRTIANLDSPGSSIVALGDSWTEGIGASSRDRTWVAMASEEIKEPIINAGRGGDTTAAALSRLERDVLAHDPKLVIVFLGGNDYLQKIPVGDTFYNLETIIQKIQERRAMILLVGFRGGLINDPYKDEFNRLALAYRLAYLPDPATKIIFDPQLVSEDRIHPNDAGYAELARMIGGEILKMLDAAEVYGK